MSTARSPQSAQQRTERGLIAASMIYALQVLVFLVLTLIFSVLTEWVGMSFIWSEQGTQHSEAMLHQELNYLNTDFKRSVIVRQPAEFAERFADHFYQWCYKKTGIESGILWLAQPEPVQQVSGFRHRIKNVYHLTSDYILAAMTITQVFAVRLAVLILAFPAFILLSLLGLVDGLVQRDIRRWSGGRESSFIYHWAKKFVLPSLILPWIIYLAMPFSVHPNLVVLPFAVLFSLSIAVMASTFKKYL